MICWRLTEPLGCWRQMETAALLVATGQSSTGRMKKWANSVWAPSKIVLDSVETPSYSHAMRALAAWFAASLTRQRC